MIAVRALGTGQDITVFGLWVSLMTERKIELHVYLLRVVSIMGNLNFCASCGGAREESLRFSIESPKSDDGSSPVKKEICTKPCVVLGNPEKRIESIGKETKGKSTTVQDVAEKGIGIVKNGIIESIVEEKNTEKYVSENENENEEKNKPDIDGDFNEGINRETQPLEIQKKEKISEPRHSEEESENNEIEKSFNDDVEEEEKVDQSEEEEEKIEDEDLEIIINISTDGEDLEEFMNNIEKQPQPDPQPDQLGSDVVPNEELDKSLLDFMNNELGEEKSGSQQPENLSDIVKKEEEVAGELDESLLEFMSNELGEGNRQEKADHNNSNMTEEEDEDDYLFEFMSNELGKEETKGEEQVENSEVKEEVGELDASLLQFMSNELGEGSPIKQPEQVEGNISTEGDDDDESLFEFMSNELGDTDTKEEKEVGNADVKQEEEEVGELDASLLQFMSNELGEGDQQSSPQPDTPEKEKDEDEDLLEFMSNELGNEDTKAEIEDEEEVENGEKEEEENVEEPEKTEKSIDEEDMSLLQFMETINFDDLKEVEDDDNFDDDDGSDSLESQESDEHNSSSSENFSTSLLQMNEEDEALLHTLLGNEGEEPTDLLAENDGEEANEGQTPTEEKTEPENEIKEASLKIEIPSPTTDSNQSSPNAKNESRETSGIDYSSASPYESMDHITQEDQDLLSQIFGQEEKGDLEEAIGNAIEEEDVKSDAPVKPVSVSPRSSKKKKRRRSRRSKRHKSGESHRRRSHESERHVFNSSIANEPSSSFNFQNLVIEDKISSGAYGVVKRGRYYSDGLPETKNQEEEGEQGEEDEKKKNKREYIDVAIKEMKVLNVKELRNVEHEINLQKKLDHPNVLGCLGSWFEGNRGFVVLELCEKGDLSKYKFRISKSKRMKMKFIEQIAKGMSYLHERQIIHRDLKAQNILVTKDKKIKICDFGTSKSVNSFKQSFVGTVEYIPAEIVFGTVDNKMIESDPKLIDVYSFGILVWEIWSTKQPFLELRRRIPNPYPLLREIHMNRRRPNVDDPNLHDMPQKLKKLMEKCWSHSPFERPQFEEITKKLKKIRKAMRKDAQRVKKEKVEEEEEEEKNSSDGVKQNEKQN